MSDPKLPPHRNLAGYLGRFKDVRLLVIGDVMLDHYIWGRVDRISPEAPVPVVEVTRESVHLGGAANVAHNIVSLGGQADLCGLIGADDVGRRIRSELAGLRIGVDGLATDRSRPTTQKTRVIAHSQQVVRFDREQRREIPPAVERRLLSVIRRRIGRAHGVVVSDYAKGVVTESLMSELIGMAEGRRIPVLVDPKVSHIQYYKGARVVTPNASEALGAAGIEDRTEEGLMRAGRTLLARLGAQAVLVTRGEQGMSLFEKTGGTTHIPTVAREVYDVTGAGDTVIATLALAFGAGAPIKEAAVLANCAAGIVVGIVGTATVPRATLARFIQERAAS